MFGAVGANFGGAVAPVVAGLEVVGAAAVVGGLVRAARAGDNKPKSKGPGVM